MMDRIPRKRIGTRKLNPNFVRNKDNETTQVILPGRIDNVDDSQNTHAGKHNAGIIARLRSARESGKLNLFNSGVQITCLESDFFEKIDNDDVSPNWWTSVNLKEVILRGCNIEKVHASVFDGCSATLQTLAMNENFLTHFPDAVLKLQELKKLVLDNNPIEALPDNLDFPNLMVFSASKTLIDRIPKSLSEGCANLKILDLSGCRLESLFHDQWSGRFPPTLESLSLSKNSLRELPAEPFAELGGYLRELNISYNQLKCLPVSFTGLLVLQTLDASHNQLENISSILPRDGKISVLLLGFNRIRTVSGVGIDSLPQLTELDVSENGLVELSSAHELAAMISLTTLNCSNNELFEIPYCLGYMPKLSSLKVVGNPVRGIRYSILQSGATKLKAYLRTRGDQPPGFMEEIGKMNTSSYRKRDNDDNSVLEQFLYDNERVREMLADSCNSGILKLSGLLSEDEKEFLQLEMLVKACVPSESFESHDSQHNVHKVGQSSVRPLAKLELAAMGYSVVPPLLSRPESSAAVAIQSLRSLDLSNNSIKAVTGSDLAAVKGLRELVLQKNILQTFSPTGNLRQLVSLDLRQNKLKMVPNEVAEFCTNMEELYVGFNPIELDQPNLSRLNSLRIVDFSNCRLQKFPFSVLKLENLENLNIENNSISHIPAEVAMLPRLKTLLLSGNPQHSVRANVVAGGSRMVIAYLRQRCDSNIHFYESDHVNHLAKDISQIPFETYSPSSHKGNSFERPLQTDEKITRVGEEKSRRLNNDKEIQHENINTQNSNVEMQNKDLQTQQHDNFPTKDMNVEAQYENSKTIDQENRAIQDKVEKLSSSIANLEEQLESFALRKTQITLLKKQLARERAERNRLERLIYF